MDARHVAKPIAEQTAPLAWVYLLWTVLEQPTKALAASYMWGDYSILKYGIAMILDPIRVPGVIWFIWALAVMFLLARATHAEDRKVQLALADGIAFAVRCLPKSVDERIIEVGGLGWRGIALYYAFFLAGTYWSTEIRAFVANNISVLTAVSMVMGWIVIAVTVQASRFSDYGPNFLAINVSGATAGVCASYLPSRIPMLGLPSTGKQTLPIYLVHYSLLIIAVIAFDVTAGTASAVVATATTAAFFASVVAISISIHRITADRILFSPPPWWITLIPAKNADTAL